MTDITEHRASHKSVRILLTRATPLENNDGQSSRAGHEQGTGKSDVGEKAQDNHSSIDTEREGGLGDTLSEKVIPLGSNNTQATSEETILPTNIERTVFKETNIPIINSTNTQKTYNGTNTHNEKLTKTKTAVREDGEVKVEKSKIQEIPKLTENVKLPVSGFKAAQLIKVASSCDFKKSVSLKLPDNISGFSHGEVTFKGGRTSSIAKQKTKEQQKSCDAMNRLETLQKQDLMKATRTRKLNSVAQSQLVCKLGSLEYYYQKQRKQQSKETRQLEDEIKKSEEENQDLSRLSLPDVTSPKPTNSCATPHRPGKVESPKTPVLVQRSDTQDSMASHAGCVRCKFNNKRHCRYFPCYLPLSYHSMGFKALEKSYTILHTYDDFLSRCEKHRPPSNVRARQAEQEAREREEMKTHSRLSIKDKERGLKHLIYQMRLKNDEKYKPREWATNYGAPLPRRMLSKPVIPVSESLVKAASVK